MKRIVESVSRGTLLILLGIIFLLINFNYLSWGFWWNVVDLWPLILIMAGVALFFGKYVPFSAVLSVFLIVLMGYSMIFGERTHWFNFSWDSQNAEIRAEQLSLPADPAVEKVKVELDLGGASVNVYPLDEQQADRELLNGSFDWRGVLGDDPRLTSNRSGSVLNVKFSTEGVRLPIGGSNKLNLGLSPNPVYEMDVDAGAISGDLDFSKLKLEKLDVDTGASDFELYFGDHGINTQVNVDSAASKIVLVVPETVGIKVSYSGVASSTNFMGSGLILDDKNWYSANYEQASTKLDVNISMAAGEVELRHQ